jgi:hypothetical protein
MIRASLHSCRKRFQSASSTREPLSVFRKGVRRYRTMAKMSVKEYFTIHVAYILYYAFLSFYRYLRHLCIECATYAEVLTFTL